MKSSLGKACRTYVYTVALFGRRGTEPIQSQFKVPLRCSLGGYQRKAEQVGRDSGALRAPLSHLELVASLGEAVGLACPEGIGGEGFRV